MNNNKDIKSPYVEGNNAYWSGINQIDCPYVEYSSDYVSWNEGYYDARDDDIKSTPSGMGVCGDNDL